MTHPLSYYDDLIVKLAAEYAPFAEKSLKEINSLLANSAEMVRYKALIAELLVAATEDLAGLPEADVPKMATEIHAYFQNFNDGAIDPASMDARLFGTCAVSQALASYKFPINGVIWPEWSDYADVAESIIFR
jgi:hypothetical protein